MRSGNNFDLIRLLLACLVVGAHLYAFIGVVQPAWVEFALNPTYATHVGVAVWVECFFVISGYLVLASWERSRGVRDYLIKRARRIYPAYAAVIVVGALVAWWATSASTTDFFSRDLLRYFAAQLTFMTQLQNTLPGAFVDQALPMVNGALWTLKVEVCFYVVMPLIAWATLRAGRPMVYTLCYGASALCFAAHIPGPGDAWSPWALQLPGQLSFFIVGMAAWSYREQLRRWLFPMLVPMAALYLIADFFGLSWLRPLALGWVVIATATAFPFQINAGRYGDLSYGIYIYHFPVIHAVIHLGLFSLAPWVGVLACFVLTIVCALLSWHLIEKRFLAHQSHYRQAAGESPMDAPPPAAPHAILGMRVDATSYAEASSRIAAWARAGEGGYICAANVHMCMEAHDSPEFKSVVNGARLVTPDGMPLVLMLRLLGKRGQRRVYGPDLTLAVLALAAQDGIPVGLYGGAVSTLEKLKRVYSERFPGLRLTYTCSPPFRPLTAEEDARIVDDIRAAGVRILLVGLGCPKQERWVAAHQDRLPCIQLAIGAAFAFHAGEVSQAPTWMQRLALEWVYRLVSEPRRLWRRYVYHNPRFVLLAGWQLLRGGS